MASAPVRVQRRLDITVLADFRKHLFQHLLAFLLLMRPRHIVIVELFHAVELLGHQGIVGRQINVPANHLIMGYAHKIAFLHLILLSYTFRQVLYISLLRNFAQKKKGRFPLPSPAGPPSPKGDGMDDDSQKHQS